MILIKIHIPNAETTFGQLYTRRLNLGIIMRRLVYELIVECRQMVRFDHGITKSVGRSNFNTNQQQYEILCSRKGALGLRMGFFLFDSISLAAENLQQPNAYVTHVANPIGTKAFSSRIIYFFTTIDGDYSKQFSVKP